jgi:carboxynorspermidine decarboxylase
VKTTTFNGVKLPSIGSYDPRTGQALLLREFGYEEYRNRLG